MSNKSIYISGKITGLDFRVAKELFDQAEEKLKQQGFLPLNPMKLVPYHPEWTWEQYMLEDIKVIFQCEHMYMLPNWKDSKGAKVEHAIAKELGHEIIYGQ